ncbi:hypothetical protein GCM10025858_38220 [Alicyclobacillus sacchari]|nr:hypothetical protein GCM10025858_38220 [Alicyclobacillus sacchari]
MYIHAVGLLHSTHPRIPRSKRNEKVVTSGYKWPSKGQAIPSRRVFPKVTMGVDVSPNKIDGRSKYLLHLARMLIRKKQFHVVTS